MLSRTCVLKKILSRINICRWLLHIWKYLFENWSHSFQKWWIWQKVSFPHLLSYKKEMSSKDELNCTCIKNNSFGLCFYNFLSSNSNNFALESYTSTMRTRFFSWEIFICYYQLLFALIYKTTFKYIYFKTPYFHIMYLEIQYEKLYTCENCIDLLIQQREKCYWVGLSLGDLLATHQSWVILLMSGCSLDQLLQIEVWELGINVLKNL